MSPRFDFLSAPASAGAAAGGTLRDLLIQKALQQDSYVKQVLAREELALRRQQEARVAAEQKATREGLEDERRFRRASIGVEHSMPGDDLDPTTQQLWRDQGFGGAMQRTVKPGSTPETFLGATPGVDDTLPEAQRTVARGGSRWVNAESERQARAQREAEARADRADRDRENREFRADQAAQNRDLQRTIAGANHGLRQDAAAAKREATEREKREKYAAVAIGRAEVRELAQSLIEDPALDSITGPVEGRRDTFFRGANVDVLRRLQQLQNKLSLEGRAKLKGQGAVSDYEGRMLAAAMSAIDRAAGPEVVRKHLKKIAETFDGDSPFERSTGSDSDEAPAVERWERGPDGRLRRAR